MLKLYGGARSRASIVQWYLEELTVPYEFVMLDLQAGEHRQPAFLAINPIGKVPAIVDEGFALWESGAILLYLAEKYGNVTSLAERAILDQWIDYANATMGPGIFSETTREKEFSRHIGMLNGWLETRSYILGEALSAADVAVGALLGYIPLMLKLNYDDYPNVANYLKRLSDRPAYQKAILGRK